jgi:hypothetical protein
MLTPTHQLRHYALWFIPRSSLALHATQLNALMRYVHFIFSVFEVAYKLNSVIVRNSPT